MARWREYNFYYLLPDGKVQYGGAWKRDRSEWVSTDQKSDRISDCDCGSDRPD